MSKKKDDNAEDKPKSGKMKLIIGAVVLIGLGAGGAYAAVQMGMLGHPAAEAAAENVPLLVEKGEEDPYAAAEGASEEGATGVVYGEGGSEYRVAYYTFEDGFTSNLRDSPGLVQVSLAASTRHDGRVIQWLTMHELAIRSAILVELADTPEDDVYSPEGKERLKTRLTAAVNRVLEENEGFGGVDEVYFRTFLVQ